MHFLVSGIPASGKSEFCKWLEEKKGFLHLDVEKPGVLDRYGLTTAWDALFGASASAAPFIEALDRFNRPVVIDWGFPPEHLDALCKLFNGGVMLWWFAADWAVARRKFAERGSGKGPIEVFDIQIRKVEAALPEINAPFGSHVEYTLPSTGIYTPPDKIWESMLDTLAESTEPAEGDRAGASRPQTAIKKPHSHRPFRPNNHAKSVTHLLAFSSVSQCREQARRVYYGAVFEIKKEIPA